MERFSGKRSRWLIYLAGMAAGVWIFNAIVLPLLLSLVPLPDALFKPAPGAVQFLDRNGIPLREEPAAHGFQGGRVPLSDVSESLIRATIAVEDKRFWSHCGVDWLAVGRAAIQYVQCRRVISGASTITMQLIKLTEPRPRTLPVKIKEALQAMRLERLWSKERILAEYLNRLDYGNRRFGCQAAAYYYFGKPASDLSVAEAAFLAGLPQSPSRLNPYANLGAARKRQQLVLKRMHNAKWLSEEAMLHIAVEPTKLKPPHRTFLAPHFIDLLEELLPKTFLNNDQPVVTSLDLRLNQQVEQALREHLARLRPHHARHGAAVVLDNRTGQVLALVGSPDYFSPDAGQVNGAWAPRSAGSTFKPFTYLLAFERDANPATVIPDIPTEFGSSNGVFVPVNYNRKFLGPVTCRTALANSLNIPAVRLLNSIGGPGVLQGALHDCGLTTLSKPPDYYGLGLTIGNAEARLLELANAYACLARLGIYKPFQLLATPTNFQNAGTHNISDNINPSSNPGNPAERRVFDSNAAWLIADILSDNLARLNAFGPNSSLRFDFPVACKTGTSTDFRDNWAFGYTPEFTVGVWIGNFDGKPMNEIAAVNGAAPVMHEIMETLQHRFGVSWYAKPESIIEKPIHPLTGKLLSNYREGAIFEKFLDGKLPPTESAEDYDDCGRVRLSPEYHRWFASAQNHLIGRAVVASPKSMLQTCLFNGPSPPTGTIYYIDPDLPDQARLLKLNKHGLSGVVWESDTLEIQNRQGQPYAILKEGRHQLRARDLVSGEKVETWIEVRSL